MCACACSKRVKRSAEEMETDDQMPDLRGEYWWEIPKKWVKRKKVQTKGGRKHSFRMMLTEL